MASIRERNGKFNVIYSYTNEKGERICGTLKEEDLEELSRDGVTLREALVYICY